ncbi:peptidoglycan-binding protein [Ciceribacter sp. L1K23]|uniref:peptidoglycan-binding domain-containing protein n=1 Tax=Ciceribacter sp. L1K23 TaxID=2820276 RepID=UPI001B840764|nr:peptidoglycan-binding domain-containing protein [Ciceribacter sp. L1K23]MBR0556500.1 peptidoglycan-binding protein [Ciceribacter sp. L1K23]
MARKRKSPNRKPTPLVLRWLMAGTAAINRQVARHPAAVGGAVCFFVVFGFVAANALWYQPGRHPSPVLRTRDAEDFTAFAGLRRNLMTERDPAEVTTFRIERESESRPGQTEVTDAPVSSETGQVLLTKSVQEELIRLGLLAGTADGVAGPVTAAAISAFEASVGMSVTGQATPELLAALKVDRNATAAVPKQRPAGDDLTPGVAVDPVAAAILSAEKTVVTQPAKKPAATPVSLPAGETMAASNMVMQIQRGLSNIAYAEITVDGVAGEQTKAAIRHFERHYRLPETGEPNERVLAKLKSIGAL